LGEKHEKGEEKKDELWENPILVKNFCKNPHDFKSKTTFFVRLRKILLVKWNFCANFFNIAKSHFKVSFFIKKIIPESYFQPKERSRKAAEKLADLIYNLLAAFQNLFMV
jgi:hypothetical protein